MKKSELFLLFFLLTVIVVISVTAVYYLIKPSNEVGFFSQSSEEKVKFEKKQSITWIDKISKQNKTFSYPSVVFKVEN